MESRVVRPGEENPPVGQQLTVCRVCPSFPLVQLACDTPSSRHATHVARKKNAANQMLKDASGARSMGWSATSHLSR